MCGDKLANVIPCNCTSVRLTKMEKGRQPIGEKLLKLPAALKNLKRNSHPKSLYSISKHSAKKDKPCHSNLTDLLPRENLRTDSMQADLAAPVCNKKRHSQQHGKRTFRAIIPSPILDENLRFEEEYNIRQREEEIVIEKVTDERENDADHLYKLTGNPLELEPIDLIGFERGIDSDTNSSTADLESIFLEEKSEDIGPEPVLIKDDETSREIFFRKLKPGLASRCRSLSEINRRVCAFDNLLYSWDLECGVGDVGPQPEALVDNYLDSNTYHKSLNRKPTTVIKESDSSSSSIIESLFTTKRPHSCCKQKPRLSWNGTTKRQRTPHTRINQVPRRRPRKVVVIGDMCSGKSSLISAYCKDKFKETYVPTILRSCLTDAVLNGQKVELVVIEVSGREDYVKLRQCAYRKTDAVVMCYCCDNITSLERIYSYWLPELENNAPNAARILVGTRKDVRDECMDQQSSIFSQDCKQSMVSESMGIEISERVGADSFIECSSKYRDGTRLVFETVAKIAMQKSRRKRKIQRTGDICSLM